MNPIYANDTPLTPRLARLRELETGIIGNLTAFAAVGMAMQEVRDHELWRDGGHKSFEDWLRDGVRVPLPLAKAMLPKPAEPEVSEDDIPFGPGGAAKEDKPKKPSKKPGKKGGRKNVSVPKPPVAPPPEIVADALGRPVPERLLPVWECRELDETLAYLKAARERVNRLTAYRVPAADLDEELRKVAKWLDSCRPYAVIPEDVEVKPEWRAQGWITKDQYENLGSRKWT